MQVGVAAILPSSEITEKQVGARGENSLWLLFHGEDDLGRVQHGRHPAIGSSPLIENLITPTFIPRLFETKLDPRR
jgi:hypothetical protein